VTRNDDDDDNNNNNNNMKETTLCQSVSNYFVFAANFRKKYGAKCAKEHF
jgi:hypothetical protein